MISTVVVPFDFNSHPVRVVMQGGEPWFVATDVAEALGYKSPKDAASVLADHQKGSGSVRTLGGEQRVTIINESGLYRLVLRSRKPEAVAFSDWVTGEVLPSVRKTGGYGTRQPVDFLEQAHEQAYGHTLLRVPPDDVTAALERKCWELTAEAGTAIREYLTTRIIMNSPANGSPVDSEYTIEAINKITLDVALGPHGAHELDTLLLMADTLASVSATYAGKLRAGAEAMYGHRPAIAALLSAQAQAADHG